MSMRKPFAITLDVGSSLANRTGSWRTERPVYLHRLPPCTPELQPAEPLWPLVREAVANEGFDDLEGLQRPLIPRCRWLMDHPEVVRGVVGFHWAVNL